MSKKVASCLCNPGLPPFIETERTLKHCLHIFGLILSRLRLCVSLLGPPPLSACVCAWIFASCISPSLLYLFHSVLPAAGPPLPVRVRDLCASPLVQKQGKVPPPPLSLREAE